MDANRILDASITGIASAAAVYLLGRASGYRFPRTAAVLVGTAIGVGRYGPSADVDSPGSVELEATAAEVESAARETAGETPSRSRTEVLSSAVEHAMGFDASDVDTRDATDVPIEGR